MSDLICLVADKNMEAVIQGLLARPAALGIRPVQYELLVHPRRDPGCFREAADFLKPYRTAHDHAVILLDHAWEGAPAETGDQLKQMLDDRLASAELLGWAEAIVIDPELEAWIFSDSPWVEQSLGWSDRPQRLRTWLQLRGLWAPMSDKPADPKAAVERALYEVRKPRSSSIYRELASNVSVDRCTDPAFVQLRRVLQRWLPPQ